jgi:hypothetical protein
MCYLGATSEGFRSDDRVTSVPRRDTGAVDLTSGSQAPVTGVDC